MLYWLHINFQNEIKVVVLRLWLYYKWLFNLSLVALHKKCTVYLGCVFPALINKATFALILCINRDSNTIISFFLIGIYHNSYSVFMFLLFGSEAV